MEIYFRVSEWKFYCYSKEDASNALKRNNSDMWYMKVVLASR